MRISLAHQRESIFLAFITQAFAQLDAVKRQAIYYTEQLANCANRPSPNNLQSPSAAMAERRSLGMYPCF